MYLDNRYNTSYIDIHIILYTMRKLIRHDDASKWPHRKESETHKGLKRVTRVQCS